MGLAMVLATNQPRSSNTRDESRSRRSPLNRVAPWLRWIIVLVFTAHGGYRILRARILNRGTSYRSADL